VLNAPPLAPFQNPPRQSIGCVKPDSLSSIPSSGSPRRTFRPSRRAGARTDAPDRYAFRLHHCHDLDIGPTRCAQYEICASADNRSQPSGRWRSGRWFAFQCRHDMLGKNALLTEPGAVSDGISTHLSLRSGRYRSRFCKELPCHHRYTFPTEVRKRQPIHRDRDYRSACLMGQSGVNGTGWAIAVCLARISSATFFLSQACSVALQENCSFLAIKKSDKVSVLSSAPDSRRSESCVDDRNATQERR